MATTAPGGGADRSVADELRRLGVKGVLVQMAERGQLLALKCEMPQCYHHEGRGKFDQGLVGFLPRLVLHPRAGRKMRCQRP